MDTRPSPIERRERLPRPHEFSDVQTELTHLIFRNLAVTVVLSGIGFVGIAFLLAQHYDDPKLWNLCAAMVVVCTVRIGIVVAFSMRPKVELTLAEALRWQAVYAGVTFFYSANMAAATVYNFRYHDSAASSLCTIGTFSLCIGFSARVGMRPWIAQLSGLTMLAALGVSVLASPEPMVRAGFFLIVLFSYAYFDGLRTRYASLVEQIRMRRKFRDLAEQDTLTGLSNRRYFQERLTTVCLQNVPFAILFIDLDRFKQVNDTHGHQVGDALLQQVAKRLCGATRKEEIVSRLGGDEFAVLQVPVLNVKAAESLAARITQEIARPFDIDGQEIRIGASVGIRMSQGEELDPHRLLRRADDALYRVKQAGGGGFSFSED